MEPSRFVLAKHTTDDMKKFEQDNAQTELRSFLRQYIVFTHCVPSLARLAVLFNKR